MTKNYDWVKNEISVIIDAMNQVNKVKNSYVIAVQHLEENDMKIIDGKIEKLNDKISELNSLQSELNDIYNSIIKRINELNKVR